MRSRSIPIRKNGRSWKENCPAARARNGTLRTKRHHGRTLWKRWTGLHAPSRIEAKTRCIKSFGELNAARDPRPPNREVHIRIVLINRFNALGTADRSEPFYSQGGNSKAESEKGSGATRFARSPGVRNW
jgi:hypothetical protein